MERPDARPRHAFPLRWHGALGQWRRRACTRHRQALYWLGARKSCPLRPGLGGRRRALAAGREASCAHPGARDHDRQTMRPESSGARFCRSRSCFPKRLAAGRGLRRGCRRFAAGRMHPCMPISAYWRTGAGFHSTLIELLAPKRKLRRRHAPAETGCARACPPPRRPFPDPAVHRPQGPAATRRHRRAQADSRE